MSIAYKNLERLDKIKNILYNVYSNNYYYRELNMRNTKQKDAILSAVVNLKNHPTADEIYSSLKQEHAKLSLGTVYRNLNKFSEKGEIRKIPIPGFGDRFDFNITDHEHFICNDCGRVFDVHLTNDVPDLIATDGMRVTGYTLILYGTCNECHKPN